ncbi:hypothetical protein [Herbaspirillum sp. SJZ107]|uniref:hypothetical protein n=1 Tax=Herbaspirillum sp. SJZ107 TaxID=2572881 RepID=UPI001154C539|nr:hypothetical protein [Herbaspirillum sp. SJZ107]TQK01276.1 hypothetical protein FBX97_5805 [Herbaspirillum sp. SJZ107]
MALQPADPELFDTMGSTTPIVWVAGADLCAALWKPTLNPSAEGDGVWRAHQWFFMVDDEMLGAITNRQDGSESWRVWSVKPAHCRKVLDALVEHVRDAGFSISY